jgi:cysteinyl-tRNA synthetase
MSSAYLGNHFEIHGGGEDLAFPHHESEIAQSEAATDQRPFVEWWMHAGMLRYEDEKMSKSLGNLVLVRDLLRSHGADAIRLYLVGHHYRSELAFHEADLDAAAVTAAQLRLAATVAEREPSPGGPGAPSGRVRERRERFLAAMDDDLDTPVAIGELVALASIALDADAPGERAEASRTLRDLGGRIVGLQLAATPSLPEVGEAVST